MSNLCIAVVFVLCVIFVIIALDALLKRRYSSIMTFAGEHDDDIEIRLRTLMRKNPDSEIIVVDKSRSPYTHTVLEKLENDFPQIHIITV